MVDGLDLEKETFTNADERTQKAIMFDLLKGLYDRLDQHLVNCDARHRELDSRKQRTLAYAVISGGVGGFLAGLAKTFFGFFTK